MKLWDAILQGLKRIPWLRGAPVRQFEQPQTGTGARQGATSNPAAAAAAPISNQHAFNHVFDGPEQEHHRIVLDLFDPMTRSSVEKSEEYRNVNGTEIKEVTERRTLSAEGLFKRLSETEGLCAEDGLPAVKIFHCAQPGCRKPLCTRHAIPVQENIFVCKGCYEQLEAQRNTWSEWDSQRGTRQG